MNEPIQPGEDNPGGGSGLPPELERILRELTGGRELDPELVAMMQSMTASAGLDNLNPQMLEMLMGQVRSLFESADDTGAVDQQVAVDIARKTVAAQSDPSVGSTQLGEAKAAVEVAALWLDQVTEFSQSGLVGTAWSRAQWVEHTMPVWRDLVDPVARGVTGAIGSAMTKQLGQLGEMPELPPGLVPPGTNPADLMNHVAPMLRRMQGSMFSMQLGQAVGTLASEVLTGNEVSIPLVPAPDVVLMPEAVRALASDLELDPAEVRLYLATRESARARLFAHVQWLGPQVLAAVRDHARDISIDIEAIEESLRSINVADPTEVQQALSGRMFSSQPSPAQQAALTRLETALALVEGWVDVVTGAAVEPHLPDAAALAEAVRRRRASGGPAEKTFAALVGLNLRPRRLRDAANLFAALEATGGAGLRESAWAHPDLAPDTSDLDDPLGYVERVRSQAAGDDVDAALDELLRDER